MALKTLCAVAGEAVPEIAALARRHGGHPGGEDVWIFDRPAAAVGFAVACPDSSALRLGIHLGEVRYPSSTVGGPVAAEEARQVARHLAALATDGQTLLSRGAFDLARQSPLPVAAELRWLAHGAWEIDGLDEPLEIFEVGMDGRSPLAAPRESASARRRGRQETILGWRPGPGLAIPRRPGWRLERRLGEGGFGEVWLASGDGEVERRVFKFCYEAERLRGLEREITLFRLLKEELGERRDIARILDWSFEEAPYFIEMEYSESGDLAHWAAARGGIESLPLSDRLEIVAQIATALAAAHSVGVLHKDIKPQNVLIHDEAGGESDGGKMRWRAQLTDFGVGLITERERLAAAGITALGWTGLDIGTSLGSGTPIYMAPELLEGKPPTLQADVYALGVLLYQMVVGDLSRALATGWQREVEDEILREDVAAAVEGSPERRLSSARELAERLRSLAPRRRERLALKRTQVVAARRQLTIRVLAVLLLLGLGIGAMTFIQSRRVAREAEAARQVSDFLVDTFRVSEPEKALGKELTAREILDRGARRLEDELADQPEIQARLMQTVGKVFYQLGLYDRAETLLEKALATRRELHGSHHAAVAETQAVLAKLRYDQGRIDESEALARESLEERRRLLGKNRLEVADSLAILAEVMHARSRFDEAEALLREALEIHRQRGSNARDEGAAMSALAMTLAYRGEYAAARTIYDEMLALLRRELGEEDPAIARGLNNLALLLHSQGEYDRAEELLRQSIDTYRKVLGDEHPLVAAGLSDLASLMQTRGDYKTAEALHREVLERYRKTLGPDHVALAIELQNLGYLLFTRGEIGEAEALYREALELRRRFFGPRHNRVASTLAYLALALEARGELDEAERIYNESLEILREDLGDEHPFVAAVVTSLAGIEARRGNFTAAERLAGQALEIFERRLPADHWRLATARSARGTALTGQGRYDEAEALLKSALAVLENGLGERSHHTRAARERLAGLYEAMGRPDEAQRYRAGL